VSLIVYLARYIHKHLVVGIIMYHLKSSHTSHSLCTSLVERHTLQPPVNFSKQKNQILSQTKSSCLHGWPPVRPLQRIPSKQITAVSQSNGSLCVMVVQHQSFARVCKHTPVAPISLKYHGEYWKTHCPPGPYVVPWLASKTVPPFAVHATPLWSTKPPVAEVDRHIIILYSAPAAGFVL